MNNQTDENITIRNAKMNINSPKIYFISIHRFSK